MFALRIEKAVARDISPPGPLWQSVTSPPSALFLCEGPALVPVRDTIKEALHMTWFLPQLGVSVDLAAGPTEEIAAQREQPVSRCHRGCL